MSDEESKRQHRASQSVYYQVPNAQSPIKSPTHISPAERAVLLERRALEEGRERSDDMILYGEEIERKDSQSSLYSEEEPTTPKGQIKAQNKVSLQEIIDVPQFRQIFRRFMTERLSKENLDFLVACAAFKCLTAREERIEHANHIYDHYVARDAPECVNLNADTVTKLHNLVLQESVPSDLFEEAESFIFGMVENDVYRRFILSDDYGLLVAATDGDEKGSWRDAKERKSFSLLAEEEDMDKLKMLLEKFSASPACTPRRRRFRKYEHAFTAHQLLRWLLESKSCNSFPAAIAMGQRLLDSFLVVNLSNNELRFKANSDFCIIAPESKKGASAMALKRQYGDQFVGDVLLLKGTVKYLRVYVVFLTTKGRIYLYRTEGAPTPFFVLPDVWGDEASAIFTGKSEVEASYMTLYHATRNLHFRIPLKINVVTWVEAFKSAMVPVTVDDRSGIETHELSRVESTNHSSAASRFSRTDSGAQ